jgi:hypothetical protein
MLHMVDSITMRDIIYTMALALGTVLIIMAITIASIGYLWHLVKPTVERTELQLLKDSNGTMVR